MASKKNKLVASRSRLQNNYLLSPVTALDIYHVPQTDRALVLAGEDTYLKIYDVATSKQLGQVKIFHSQPIHGIHVSKGQNGTRVLIWGGQSVSVLSHTSLRALIQGDEDVPQPREFKAPDWIYDGILSPYDDTENGGVLVTAHNEIVPFSSSSNGESLVFGPLTSPSRPILYSANLCWLSPEEVLVAGGTVFGEIIVWKYFTSPDKRSGGTQQWELLYVFTGHEGSIFGVSISPEIELASDGTKIRVLASCSDDRTIRIWDITAVDRSVSEAPVADGSKAVLGDARETGFGGNSSNSEAKEEHQNDSARCLAVAMGHVSRIWHVKFTGETNHHSPSERSIDVWSFGEDCTRQKWELSLDLERWKERSANNYRGSTCIAAGNVEPVGVLKHCSTNPCHIGKNIWSAAVALGGDGQPLVVSGGADGKIAISGGQSQDDIGTSGSGYSDIDLTLSVDDVLVSLGVGIQAGNTTPRKQVKKSATEGFQRYAFLSEQSFLATTTSGRLLLGRTVQDGITWENVDISEEAMADLKLYNIIKSPAPGVAVLGSASGKLYLFRHQEQTQQPQTIQELTQLPKKVSDIICLQDPNQQPNTWTIIATMLGQDHAMMLTFETTPIDRETKMVSSRRINLTQHFVITAAAFCKGRLIIGSRIGVLAVQKTNTTEDGVEVFETVYSRKDCKTKDAVTCIVPLPGSSDSFLAGCRDGRYRVYTLNTNNGGSETVLLRLQHEISPPLGMIEGAWFTTASPTKATIELILYGFRGNNFIVWSETSRQELASVECGGAHRPFDTVSPVDSSGQLKLVFTKAAQMHFYSQRGPLLRALKEGGHGRELRAVAASSCSSSSSEKFRYIATAAEDTTIRIWQYNSESNDSQPGVKGHGGGGGGKFKPLAVIEKHSAGIQHLKWHGNKYLLSSGGQEEFFIWRVTRLQSEYESLAVVCEAVYDDKSVDGDLRIVDFDVCSLGSSVRVSQGDIKLEVVDKEEEETLLISLALSNSTIKSYVYSRSGGFRLLVTGGYTGACLTQIRHLEVVPAGDGAEIHLLTGSTDGYLALWSSTASLPLSLSSGGEGSNGGGVVLDVAEYSLSSAVKVHQSTVKSLDIAPTGNSDEGWLVATGGDDNALGFTRLSSSREPRKFTVTNRSRIAGAHAAAITGLAFVDGDGGPGENEPTSDVESRQLFHLATASNDQRVKLWRIDLVSEVDAPPRVSLMDNQYSSVADPGDVEVIPSTDLDGNGKGKFMVGGVGMEVWDLV